MAEHWAKVNVPRYLKEKRARKLARRQHRVERAEAARQNSLNNFYAKFGEKSKIVQMLAEQAFESTAPFKSHRLGFRLPADFSLIDSPERSLAALSELAHQMCSTRLSTIYLDQSKLKNYDLTANGLLDVLVDELSTEARRTGRAIKWRGAYPTDAAIRRVVQAVGVIKRLKVIHEYPLPDEAARLEVFDARSKHYVRALRPHQADRKARVTKDFADHINRCLGRVGRRLTEGGLSRMCQYVGEILDNAEEHAGMLDWTIQGYLDTHNSALICEIAIFNFGRTIAQTLEELPSESFTKQQIQRYIDIHASRGWIRKGWRKEDLYTLIALQGNVSSKNYTQNDTRGNGTVDLIEFFQKVQQECTGASEQTGKKAARMVIVSGSTYILFDGKYKMQVTETGNRVVAFNASNSLEEKPDANYVRPLEGVSFPGTAIGIQFSLRTDDSTVVTSVGAQ